MPAEVLRYAAFTDGGCGGNPAGVVLDADELSVRDMLAVAAEVGYSETAFVGGPGADGGRPVRYFSPRAEVAFCGHATIATAVALAERDGPRRLALATAAGPVTVDTAEGPDGLVATLTAPPARTAPAAPEVVDRLLTALRYARADLDPAYPVHVAFAGNSHPMVAVRTRALLAALDYDYPALERLMTERGWTTVHVFWAESPVLFHARDPFPPGGVVEDPATGAAAAAFGGYLRDVGLVDVPAELTVRQGEDVGRPSRLLVEVLREAVHVGGAATRMA
ncbi:MAG: PhzF family phenazine biosynthesis protein [Nocardioidaceae bacterium]